MLAPPEHSITAAGRWLFALALALHAGAGSASASSGDLRVALLIGEQEADRSWGFTKLFQPELDHHGGMQVQHTGAHFGLRTFEYRVTSGAEALRAVEMAAIGRDLDNQTTVLDEGAHVLITFSYLSWVKDVIALAEELKLPNIHTFAGNPLLYDARNDWAFGIQLPFHRLHKGPMSWARLNGLRTAAVVRSASGAFYKANGLSSIVWANQAALKLVGPSNDWCERWANWTSSCNFRYGRPYSSIGASSTRIMAPPTRHCRCGEQDLLEQYRLMYNLSISPSFYEVDEEKLLGSSASDKIVHENIVKFNRGIIEDIQKQSHGDYIDVLSSWVKSRWSLMAALKEAYITPKMLLVHGENTMEAAHPDGSPALEMRDGFYQMSAVQWHRNMSIEDPLLGKVEDIRKHYEDRTGKVLDNGSASAAAAGVVLYHAVCKYSVLETSMSLTTMRDELRKAIRSVNDQTLFGRVRFNTFGQNDGRDLVVFQQIPENATTAAFYDAVVLGLEVASRRIEMPFPTWAARQGCPPGKRNVQDHCQECHLGRYNAHTTAALMVTWCPKCPSGRYSGVGATHCEECGDGYRARDDGTECIMDPSFYALISITAALVWTAFHLLVVTLWYPCEIADIYQADNKIILKTARTHYWTMRGRSSLPVKIEGTGHPFLDKPGLFRVRSDTLQVLQLLDENGKNFPERVDSSQGTVRLGSCLHELLHVGFVPLGVIVPFCFGGMLTTSIISEVSQQAELVIVFGAAGIGLLTGFIWRMWGLLRKTPLQKLLHEFKGSLRAKNPHPEKCPRGPSRGVALSDLLDLFNHFEMFVRDRNMYYMFANILVPLTKHHKLSYAEVLGPKPLQWFVSHFWGTPFRHFCESIQKHAESTLSLTASTSSSQTTYWICSLSNNQWHVEDELSETLEQSSFYLALWSETCKGVCMVLDSEATPLQRSWCLFEVLQTFKLEQTRKEAFAGLLFCTSIGCLNHGFASTDVVMALGDRISHLSLKDAHATSERDRKVIEERVSNEPGGFPAMDQFVRKRIRKALVAAHGHVESEFHRVLHELPTTSDNVGSCDDPQPGAATTCSLDYAKVMDEHCLSIDL